MDSSSGVRASDTAATRGEAQHAVAAFRQPLHGGHALEVWKSPRILARASPTSSARHRSSGGLPTLPKQSARSCAGVVRLAPLAFAPWPLPSLSHSRLRAVGNWFQGCPVPLVINAGHPTQGTGRFRGGTRTHLQYRVAFPSNQTPTSHEMSCMRLEHRDCSRDARAVRGVESPK